MSIIFPFDNSYAHLGEAFSQAVRPVPVANPTLICLNESLASELGMTERDPAVLTSVLSGNTLPDGAEPVATVYAGHQFGNFVPQLGDGRAVLLGEVVCEHGVRYDIQLKGSGQTPFSRRGDGRAALGPIMRECIVSEAMYALGIPTTRVLACVTTGEPVMRETMLPGALLTRVAQSHIRIGTFEYFAARGEWDALRQLAYYTIARLYPKVREADNPYAALLQAMIERQASLVAAWMGVGFIHGVMNTDNMALSGETIDYGPCAFMDKYHPLTVFSAIDQQGRYAFGRQPAIAQWNLIRFAETLVPLIDADRQKAIAIADEILSLFPERFTDYWTAMMRRKLGFLNEEEGDGHLAHQLLDNMAQTNADYTVTFRELCDAAEKRVYLPFASYEWTEQWYARLARQPATLAEVAASMRMANPAYIPRNHRIEEAIVAGVERGDFMPMQTLLELLGKPYEEREGFARFMRPPLETERVTQTFCGT